MNTAEEFFRKKIKEDKGIVNEFSLANVKITGEQAMRWAHEFAEQSRQAAVSGSLPLETKLEMFYDFLYERGIASQLGVGIDTVVKHFIDEKLSGNDR